MIIYLLIAVAVFYLVLFLLKPIIATFRDRPATTYVHQFFDPQPTAGRGTPKAANCHPFPSIFDEPEKYISFIVPVYNEENRLPDMMNETMEYLESRAHRDRAFTYEVIIVDDGSKDNTVKVAMGYVKKYGADNVRVLKLGVNQGKGGAVQQGMLHARGQYLLMVDGDGATRIEDLESLETRLKQAEQKTRGGAVAVGSRAHYQDSAVAKRAWYRNILMHGFHFLVSLLCVRGIRDTQCGFKLFSRSAATHLFLNQHLRRWSFDVELLFIAQQLNIPIVEVAVNWTEIPGSKVDVVAASLMMGRDLLVIRFSYLFGVWKVLPPSRFVNDVRGAL